MKNNLLLGLDLDGTLADHTQAKLKLAQEFGYTLSPKETASEFIKDVIAHEHYRPFQKKLYEEFSHMATKSEFLDEALNELRQRGWSFALVSRRQADGHEAARLWLEQNLPGFIPEERIFFVEKDEDKADVCRVKNISAFVDDQTNVLEFMDNSILKILFDPFGNWDNEPSKTFIQAKSWRDIPSLLLNLE